MESVQDFMQFHYGYAFDDSISIERMIELVEDDENGDIKHPEELKEFCEKLRDSVNDYFMKTAFGQFVHLHEVHLEDLADWDDETIQQDPVYYMNYIVQPDIPEGSYSVRSGDEEIFRCAKRQRFWSPRMIADWNDMNKGVLKWYLDYCAQDIINQMIPFYINTEDRPNIKKFYHLSGGPLNLVNRSTPEYLDICAWTDGTPILELY